MRLEIAGGFRRIRSISGQNNWEGFMAKRLSRPAISAAAEGTPRLGVVVRFTPQASRSGIKQLEGGGFRVASSKDFRSAAAVPNDFDGADVQYFERFGIAIVRRDGERLRPMVEKAMQQ